MLAPRELPRAFAEWNHKYKAPFGSKWWTRLLGSKWFGIGSIRYTRMLVWKYRTRWPSWVIRSIGPFGFQTNSATRIYEYPWAYYATPLGNGCLRAVDVGSGASGFQFVLASAGIRVVSVDPLINPSESVNWRFSIDDFHRLNRAFGARVKFICDLLEAAHLESDNYDRIFAISVLEHIPWGPLKELVREIARILKPGGYFVATIDLFLDCYPFTKKEANEYGGNISVKDLIEASGLQLVFGEPSDLCGFAEFSPEAVIRRKDDYLVVNNVMTQCIVMQKNQKE